MFFSISTMCFDSSHIIFKSSCQEVFRNVAILENSQRSLESICAGVFLNKAAGCLLATLLKNPSTGVSLGGLQKFFRIAVL